MLPAGGDATQTQTQTRAEMQCEWTDSDCIALTCKGDNLVHTFQGAEPDQVGVLREVDARVNDSVGGQHLVAEGQADGVKAHVHDLAQQRLVAAHPQTLRNACGRFESRPSGQADRQGMRCYSAQHSTEARAVGTR